MRHGFTQVHKFLLFPFILLWLAPMQISQQLFDFIIYIVVCIQFKSFSISYSSLGILGYRPNMFLLIYNLLTSVQSNGLWTVQNPWTSSSSFINQIILWPLLLLLSVWLRNTFKILSEPWCNLFVWLVITTCTKIIYISQLISRYNDK